MFSQSVYAQWGLFAGLLGQLGDTTQQQFSVQWGGLDSTLSVDQQAYNAQLQELYGLLGQPSPGGGLDSSWLSGLDAGQDTLAGLLPDLGIAGSDTVLTILDSVQNLAGASFDSLGGLLGQYQDSLSFDSANWNVQIIGFDSLNEVQLGILQDTFAQVSLSESDAGAGVLSGLLGQLFDESIFPDFELAFGRQEAQMKYYEEEYAAQAMVFRMGSVPRFDREVPGGRHSRLPIEARWHVQASWLSRPLDAYLQDPENRSGQPEAGFHPLLLRGDFAMMATPGLGQWGNTSFRMISSLGMEFGTFAPAHRDYAPPFTTYNKGFATGFGPQAGGGFSMTTGPLVIYALATVSHGKTINSDNRYVSRQVTTGMRFGNTIHVCYSTGESSWQETGNRTARVRHQFTVGMIF
ncbi:MAG: hypothetical protein RLY31_27 [Bacteroidota bacterium]|jgi:hypothetical protein